MKALQYFVSYLLQLVEVTRDLADDYIEDYHRKPFYANPRANSVRPITCKKCGGEYAQVPYLGGVGYQHTCTS